MFGGLTPIELMIRLLLQSFDAKSFCITSSLKVLTWNSNHFSYSSIEKFTKMAFGAHIEAFEAGS